MDDDVIAQFGSAIDDIQTDLVRDSADLDCGDVAVEGCDFHGNSQAHDRKPPFCFLLEELVSLDLSGVNIEFGPMCFEPFRETVGSKPFFSS